MPIGQNRAVTMYDLFCTKCGCAFSIPNAFFGYITASQDPIYCPVGHENYFQHPKEMADATEKLVVVEELLQQTRAELTTTKGAMVSIRHRCEQYEAKLHVPDHAPVEGVQKRRGRTARAPMSTAGGVA